APEKIYLDNPNQIHALSLGNHNVGTQREIFFLDMLSFKHKIAVAMKGDFLVDHTYVFEIGGRKKSFEQIKSEKEAFLAIDDTEKGVGAKIPLWLFGFLY